MLSRAAMFCAKWAAIILIPVYLFKFVQSMGITWGAALCQYLQLPANDHGLGTFCYDFPGVIAPPLLFLCVISAAFLAGIGTRGSLRMATIIACVMSAVPVWMDVTRVFPSNPAAILTYWGYYEAYGNLMLWACFAVSIGVLAGLFLLVSHGPRRLKADGGRTVDAKGPWQGRYASMFQLWWWHFSGRKDGLVVGERYERCKEINWQETPWGKAFAWVFHTIGVPIAGGGSAPLIRVNPKGHLLTVAGSGGGKSTGYAITNLLLGWNKTFIAMDISSELWRATAKVRELFGRKVVYFNPSDENTWGCNVVGGMGKNPETRDVDAKKICGWIKSQQASGGGGGGEVFETHGWAINEAVIIVEMIRAERDKRPWSLATVADILLSADVEAKIQDMYSSYPEVKDLLGPVLATAAVETRSGYYANATKNLKSVASASGKKLFCGLARRNFELTDLIRGGTDLYIRMRTDDLPMYAASLQLFFGALNSEIRNQCESKNQEFCKGDKLKEQLVYLLDEFPQIASKGEACTIIQGIETMRKYNVIYWLFAQSRGQYYQIYGDKRGRTIDDSCYLRMYLAIEDDDTAAMLSKRAGNISVKTESVTHGESGQASMKSGGASENSGHTTNVQKDALVSPEHIQMMCVTDDVPDEQLLVQRGRAVARVGICRYYRRPSLMWLYKMGQEAGEPTGPVMVDAPDPAAKAA